MNYERLQETVTFENKNNSRKQKKKMEDKVLGRLERSWLPLKGSKHNTESVKEVIYKQIFI